MQKLSNYKLLAVTIFILAALTLLAACANDMDDEFEAEDKGQLKLDLSEFRAQAMIENILEDIELDKIEIEIRNEDDEYKKRFDFDEEDIILDDIAVGEYEVLAQAIEVESEEKEYIIYEGSKEISIAARATTEAEIELMINNVSLTVEFPEIEDHRDGEEELTLVLEKFLNDSLEDIFEKNDAEQWQVEFNDFQAERWDLSLEVANEVLATKQEHEFLPGRDYYLFIKVDNGDLSLVSDPDKEPEFPYPDLCEDVVNETIMQAFYWEMYEVIELDDGTVIDYRDDYPEEKDLWELLADERAEELAEAGITALWLPPAAKGYKNLMEEGRDIPADVGYGVYDFWDLGEFEQKDTTRTKYGTRDKLEDAIEAIHDNDMKAYFDVVFNHRMGADFTEEVNTQEHGTIEAWTGFEGTVDGVEYSLAGRDEYYTESSWDDLWHDFKWNQNASGVFTAVDWDHSRKDDDDYDGENTYLFEGKDWSDTFSDDYLMGANVDYYSGDWENEQVVDEMKAWGEWIVNEIGFDGFRMDATAHVDNRFIRDWVEHVQNNSEKDVFFVAEAWVENVAGYLSQVDDVGSGQLNDLKAFDFTLRDYFAQLRDGNLDLSYLERDSNNSLANTMGYDTRAVTFLDNHDTNRDREGYGHTPINNRAFQAYSYILTRKYSTPTVFWKDYYQYDMGDNLDKLISARKHFAYGAEIENSGNNDRDTYSYTRAGLDDTPGTGLVMVISASDSGGETNISVNSGRANTTYIDYTGNVEGEVTTDSNGWGEFRVQEDTGEGWSIWVPSDWDGDWANLNSN